MSELLQRVGHWLNVWSPTIVRVTLEVLIIFAIVYAFLRIMEGTRGAGVLKGDTMTLLHRVVFYGDHLQSMTDLGALMGFNVVREG